MLKKYLILVTLAISIILQPVTAEYKSTIYDFDLNDDGIVNVDDLIYYIFNMNNSEQFDINLDHKIDIEDIQILAKVIEEHPSGKEYELVLNNTETVKINDNISIQYFKDYKEYFVKAEHGGWYLKKEVYSFEMWANYYCRVPYHKYDYDNYHCGHFSRDVALTALANIGFGYVAKAIGEGHAYNVVLIDEDWTNPENWIIYDFTTPEYPVKGDLIYMAHRYRETTCKDFKCKEYAIRYPYKTMFIEFPLNNTHAILFTMDWEDKKIKYFGIWEFI